MDYKEAISLLAEDIFLQGVTKGKAEEMIVLCKEYLQKEEFQITGKNFLDKFGVNPDYVLFEGRIVDQSTFMLYDEEDYIETMEYGIACDSAGNPL